MGDCEGWENCLYYAMISLCYMQEICMTMSTSSEPMIQNSINAMALSRPSSQYGCQDDNNEHHC